MTDASELMRVHIEALFTFDADRQLARVNEPDGALAPRFFLGQTADGVVTCFRRDVEQETREELQRAVQEDLRRGIALGSRLNPTRYEEILDRSAPVARTWAGPAFSFPGDLTASTATIVITEENADLLRPLLEEWVPDVRHGEPMVALLVDGRAVALCCSSRRTSVAHEAGVETARAHRGRGYAGQAAAAWARAVRDMGCVPLYSTSWKNEASRAVARKLSLIHFGSDLHVT
jgi:RimJ/RimL family protein N-acetyltransferase